MKLSTTTGIYRSRQDGSYVKIAECMPLLYEAGFRDLDVSFAIPGKGTLELCENDWRQWADDLRNRMEKQGMTCGQSHAPFYRGGSLPEKEEDCGRARELLCRSIEAASIIGAKSITIHRIRREGCETDGTAKNMNLEFFKPLLELAEKCGISIAIENMFDFAGCEGGRFRYLCFPEELIDLVDILGKDFGNVGICWDFGHANSMSIDQPQALRKMGKRLIATHVNDNFGRKDDHLVPFVGQVAWQPVMEALRDIGYEGNLTFETGRFTVNMPDALIPEALRFTVAIGRYLLSLAAVDTEEKM